MYGACPLGDGPQQINLIHLLQRAAIPQAEGSRAADYQYRAAREIGVGDSGDAIGDAGTGSQEGYSGPARAFGPALGGVYRRLLVARIDDADAFAHASIVNTGDMPAAQGEDYLDCPHV